MIQPAEQDQNQISQEISGHQGDGWVDANPNHGFLQDSGLPTVNEGDSLETLLDTDLWPVGEPLPPPSSDVSQVPDQADAYEYWTGEEWTGLA